MATIVRGIQPALLDSLIGTISHAENFANTNTRVKAAPSPEKRDYRNVAFCGWATFR
jgi:hypothetical protein